MLIKPMITTVFDESPTSTPVQTSSSPTQANPNNMGLRPVDALRLVPEVRYSNHPPNLTDTDPIFQRLRSLSSSVHQAHVIDGFSSL